MITLESILTPRQVTLDLRAKTGEAAVLEVAGLLRQHPKMKNWDGFFRALRPGTTCMVTDSGYGVCIPHARTNDVTGMVMAAGRSRGGVLFPGSGDEETRVHYLIVIGIPTALAQDYLRLIGGIARTFRSAGAEMALRSATTPEQFIRALATSQRSL